MIWRVNLRAGTFVLDCIREPQTCKKLETLLYKQCEDTMNQKKNENNPTSIIESIRVGCSE